MLPVNTHSKTGECEVCPKTDVLITVHYGNMWMCDECWEKEQKLQSESTQNQQKRVDDLVARSREIDQTVQVKTDLFNASTVAIVELKAAIDNNPAIENKKFALAEEIKNRIVHMDGVIFSKREELLKLENERRMYQVNLQSVANSLRAEERERLKIQDVSYTPVPPKVVKPPKERVSTAKFKKEEVRAAALKYNVPEAALQMLVVARKITPEDAGKQLADALKKTE